MTSGKGGRCPACILAIQRSSVVSSVVVALPRPDLVTLIAIPLLIQVEGIRQ